MKFLRDALEYILSFFAKKSVKRFEQVLNSNCQITPNAFEYTFINKGSAVVNVLGFTLFNGDYVSFSQDFLLINDTSIIQVVFSGAGIKDCRLIRGTLN